MLKTFLKQLDNAKNKMKADEIELERLHKEVTFLKGKNKLDEILKAQISGKDRYSVGYTGNSNNNKTVFVSAGKQKEEYLKPSIVFSKQS